MDNGKDKLSITWLTKGKLPSLPFLELKEKILGKKYELSIAFVTPKISKDLNRRYRNKNKSTNILSFSIDKNIGELVIDIEAVKKDAPKFNKNYARFLGHLVIHGMLHLKGFEHSSKMDSIEEKHCLKFGF